MSAGRDQGWAAENRAGPRA